MREAKAEAAISEAVLQRDVIEMAGYLGWKHYHTHDSRRSVAGFPDLVLVKDRVIWVELKSRRGAVSAAQAMWLEALRNAGQEVHVFRPRDWQDGTIERCLREDGGRG